MAALLAMTMPAQAPARPDTPPPAPVTAPGTATAPPETRNVRINIRFADAARRRPASYEIVRRLILVRGTVAGREAWIMLDTGARRSIVDTGLARSAGLPIAQAPGSIATPSGPMAARRVAGLTLAVTDQIDVRLSEALAADLRPVSTALGRRVDAVLGWDILARLALLVDPRDATLRFSGSGLLPPPAGAAQVPLSANGRVPASVGKEDLSLFVDLGSNHVIGLRTGVWDRVAPAGAETRPLGVIHGQGNRAAGRVGRLPGLNLGRVAISDVPTAIETDRTGGGADQADGHVGMGLLGRFIFLIDAGQGRLWLQQPDSAPPAARPRQAAPQTGAGR